MPEIKALSSAALRETLANPTDFRLFAAAEALRRGFTLEELRHLTGIDFFFLHKLARIIALSRNCIRRKPGGRTAAAG